MSIKVLVQKGGSGFEDDSQKFEDHKKCVQATKKVNRDAQCLAKIEVIKSV